MTTTLRIDNELKQQCDEVFAELGLTMSSAMTIFLKQVVRTRSIPFEISANNGWNRFESQRRARIAAGEREWTMDEINAEIASAHQATPTTI